MRGCAARRNPFVECGASLYPTRSSTQMGGQAAEIELAPCDLVQQTVRVEPLPPRPQRPQPVPRLRVGEPLRPEAPSELAPPVHLERPGAQVAGDVEALIHVG